jgi:hypothetical protein
MDLTTPPPVTETSSADMERAVAVIALAFTADPVMRWIFPDRGRYLTYFPAFLRVLASTAVQHGTALQVGDCAGAALWLPPNVGPDRAAISAIMHEGVAPSRQTEVFAFMERTGATARRHSTGGYRSLVSIRSIITRVLARRSFGTR